MNNVVRYKIEGKEYIAGMIEEADKKGFYHWSLYWIDGGGTAFGKREAKACIRAAFIDAIKSGEYKEL
jgi:hypothetical protein